MTSPERRKEAAALTLTYKYRIKDRRARKALARHAVAVNQIWNYCNAVQRDIEDRYKAGAPKRRWPTNYDLQKLVSGTSKDLGIHSSTAELTCDQFAISRDRAKHSLRFRSSFGQKRALGWIPFKKKGRQIDGNSVIYRGKRYRWFGDKRRPLPDTAKGGAFVEDALGRWWVCFHVDVPDRQGAISGKIGIDLGLKSLASISTGEVVENPRHLSQWAERLAVAQRAGNKRRTKAIHARISNIRRDFHHKLSTRLSREYAFIAVGNVNAKHLAKSRMAKSVFDAGWSSFRNMLRYKAGEYREVDESFTTVTCSACGARSGPKGQKGLRIREWACVDCGVVHDRDHNGAKNILARSVAGPVEGSRRAAR